MSFAFRPDQRYSTRRVSRFALLVGVAALLGGCASFSADGGVGTAQSIAYAELNKDVVKIGDDATASVESTDASSALGAVWMVITTT